MLLLFHHGGVYNYSIAGVSVERFEPFVEAFLLGGFVFLSGYLAVTSFEGSARGSPWRFLTSRFWRVYPPYLAALVLFGTIVGVTLTKKDWLAHILALQLVLVPAVEKVAKTVWFIGMIWVFFVLLAAILAVWKRPWSILAAMAVLYLAAWLVHVEWGWMDARLLYFFPVFALSAVIAKGHWLPRLLGTRFFHLEKVALAGIGAGLLLAFPQTSQFDPDPLAVGAFTVFILTAGALALALLRPIADRRIAYRIVFVLSAASFFVYLFHRPIWRIVLAIFPGETPDRTFAIRMLLATPIVIAVSYVLQAGYDRFLDSWQAGRRQRKRGSSS